MPTGHGYQRHRAKWWSNVITGEITMPDKKENECFLEKHKKTRGDIRRFNDLTYESLSSLKVC